MPDLTRAFTGLHTKGPSSMRKNLSIALAFLLLIAAAPLLGACHTTAGAGQDLSDAGHVITHDADRHSP
jgi:predicted small secreted protein